MKSLKISWFKKRNKNVIFLVMGNEEIKNNLKNTLIMHKISADVLLYDFFDVENLIYDDLHVCVLLFPQSIRNCLDWLLYPLVTL